MTPAVRVRPLRVRDALELVAPQFRDDRGLLTAPFQSQVVEEAVGHRMPVAQANVSVSRRGALRGIHYADVPPSQAKLVTAVSGALLDFVVDLRVGSPTFGLWDCVLLDTVDRRAVYVPEGMGHALFALEDGSTALYLCSTPFTPGRERGVNPFDSDVALALPAGVEPVVSAKDAAAPTLEEARRDGLLPSFEACVALYASLRGAAASEQTHR